MDYYRTSTELIDSWDFLNFPAKQPQRDLYRERSVDDSSRRFPGRCRPRVTRKKRWKEPSRDRKIVESSTSLILKKTDKPIFNDYSVLSFTNITRSRGPVYGDFGANQRADDVEPLIKAAIFPKTDKKTDRTKRIYKSIKNWNRTKNESSINDKYVYLVVAGRKKEKVYELNTRTVEYSHSIRKHESSTTDCCKIKELLKINLNKCKKSIHSLQKVNAKLSDGPSEYGNRQDCERTDTKLRRKEEENITNMPKNRTNPTQGTKKNTNAAEEFRWTVPVTETRSNKEGQKSPRSSVRGQRSRVRITGRLGRTEDDKYVFKCNATLDDEPIPTFPTNENLMPMGMCIDGDSNRSPGNKRDSNIQTDFRYYTSPSYRQTSQATQANLEIYYPQNHNTNIIANSDKIIQCYCINTSQNKTSKFDERGEIALKECSSPIVIISVYSQPESRDKVKGKEDMKKTIPTQVEFNEKNPKKVVNSEEVKKTLRSRCPSPVRGTVKENSKEVKSWATTTNSKKRLLESALTTFRSAKINSGKAQTSAQVHPAVSKKTERLRSPVSPRYPSPSRRAGPKMKQKNTTGTNTDHTLAKKALVDSFTKQYTAWNDEINIKDANALNSKHDVSNLTVKIEGDTDYYNVMFSQGAHTDLTVRKTPKGTVANYQTDNDANSLGNFLFIEPDTERKRTSFSQTFMSDAGDPHIMTPSTLHVRDSLQVSHWREDKHSNVGKTTQTNQPSNRNDVDNKFLGQTKHFQGDECSISDPNERDKEIRELLGIDKGRFKPPPRKFSQASADFGHRNEVIFAYSYQDHSDNVCKGNNKNKDPANERKLFPQLIFNRNVQVLLQINRINKHHPIVLSRQQYVKVKKAIYSIQLKKNSSRHLRQGLKNSSVSIGSIKMKTKVNLKFHYDKETQTEHKDPFGSVMRGSNIRETAKGDDVYFNRQLENNGEAKGTGSVRKSLDRRSVEYEKNGLTNRTDQHSQLSLEQNEMHLLYNSSFTRSQHHSKYGKVLREQSNNSYPRKAASSLAVQYTEVSYSKEVKFSSADLTHMETPESVKHSISQNLEQKESHSIHTIFKGYRRTRTPNLGTSAYSICPESISKHSNAFLKPFGEPEYCDLKPKKPFLRRLISCLVMRASRTSTVKLPVGLARKAPSLPSSIDSYHINTSLGGVEMSSSIYDTSISFYSNHTIWPVSKMKRGFFNSVRGFLGSRKS